MGIRLITDESKPVEVDLGVAKLFIQPLSNWKLQELRRKCTTAGATDEAAFEVFFWQEALVGWEDIYDASDNLVEYDRKVAAYLNEKGEPAGVGPGLGESYRTIARSTALMNEVRLKEELGNSEESSRSDPAGTDSPE